VAALLLEGRYTHSLTLNIQGHQYRNSRASRMVERGML